jgi:hypothetical protein
MRQKKDEGERQGFVAALWRGRPIITLALACVLVAAAYFQLTRIAEQPSGGLLPPGARDFVREQPQSRFRALGPADLQLLQRQRKVVDDLARRYAGSVLNHGDPNDLRVVQQILDAHVLEADQTFALQSLGVALGDVMAAQLGLHWVVYRDELGESRALRLGETDTVVFPVTMISKRVEMGVPFSVEELYQKGVDAVREHPAPAPQRPRPPERPRLEDG